MPVSPAEHVYSVAEITELIKGTLEEGFPWVTIQGEISNFRPSGAGHWYFSLKDSDAILSVVMFRGRLDAVRFAPADGTLVKATGSVSVYARNAVLPRKGFSTSIERNRCRSIPHAWQS